MDLWIFTGPHQWSMLRMLAKKYADPLAFDRQQKGTTASETHAALCSDHPAAAHSELTDLVHPILLNVRFSARVTTAGREREQRRAVHRRAPGDSARQPEAHGASARAAPGAPGPAAQTHPIAGAQGIPGTKRHRRSRSLVLVHQFCYVFRQRYRGR